MSPKQIILALLATFLYACASPSQIQIGLWERNGTLRVAEPDNTNHDYKFYIAIALDFGLNTESRKDREYLISQYLEKVCKAVEIVDEHFLPSSAPAVIVSKRGTFVHRVKCLK
jgi:hypothetical protein